MYNRVFHKRGGWLTLYSRVNSEITTFRKVTEHRVKNEITGWIYDFADEAWHCARKCLPFDQACDTPFFEWPPWSSIEKGYRPIRARSSKLYGFLARWVESMFRVREHDRLQPRWRKEGGKGREVEMVGRGRWPGSNLPLGPQHRKFTFTAVCIEGRTHWSR